MDKPMSRQSQNTKRLAYHFVDKLSDWAKLTTRPLFGAEALYRNDHVFAMVWEGGLYFKVDDHSREEYEAAGSHPLGYVSEGENRALKSYMEVPTEVLEDVDKLHEWAERAYQVALRARKS